MLRKLDKLSTNTLKLWFSQLNRREFDLKTVCITVIRIHKLGEGVSKASHGEHCGGYLGVSIVPN